jgi:3-hydroxyisobutyrate dehydrogenase-like beta-hydroxyacid dehydrogenase
LPVKKSQNTRKIAFIGFGEVGQRFAKDLLVHDDMHIAAYDVLFGQSVGENILSRAKAMGVLAAQTSHEAMQDAGIVISAVTASQAVEVAHSASQHLKAGQIFLDVNSAAPSTKQRAAQFVETTGAHYVECAVMAAVLKPGLAVPILAGGPHAIEAAALMNALGMNLTPVATEYGKASAMKLCRSIMIKGLEALMLDCAAASEAWDVKEPVFASLAETFPSIDWHDLCENMRERVARHGIRRAAEMREAGEMLDSLGIIPELANAVAQAQWRGAIRKSA